MPLYVAFSQPCIRNLARNAAPSIIAISWPEWRPAFVFVSHGRGIAKQHDGRSRKNSFRYRGLRMDDSQGHHRPMHAILRSLILCSAFALPAAQAGRPLRGNDRPGRVPGRGRRLRKLPHRRSRKALCRRQAHRYAVRRDLFAQHHAGPGHRYRRLERAGFLPCAALWRGA